MTMSAARGPSRLLGQASLWLHSGRRDEALRALAQVLALEPDHPQALGLLGYAHLLQRDYPAARLALLDALDGPEGQPVMVNRLGQAFYGEGRYGCALACFHRVIELAPQALTAHRNALMAWQAQVRTSNERRVQRLPQPTASRDGRRSAPLRVLLLGADVLGGQGRRTDPIQHLATVDGEPLLLRTLGQLERAGVQPQEITVVVRTGQRVLHQRVCQAPVKWMEVREPPRARATPAWPFLATRLAWSLHGRTLWLPGATWFSDVALTAAVHHDRPGFWATGRSGASARSDSRRGDVHALRFDDAAALDSELDLLDRLYRCGVCRPQTDPVWALLQMLAGEDPNMRTPAEAFMEVDDGTERFRSMSDLRRWQARGRWAPPQTAADDVRAHNSVQGDLREAEARR